MSTLPINGESKTLEEFFARIDKLTKYAITFGQKYRHEPHSVLGMDARLPDGYMTLWAESEIAARQWLVDNIDNAYCSIDDEAHFVAEAAAHYRLGRLGDVRGRLVAGHLRLPDHLQRDGPPVPLVDRAVCPMMADAPSRRTRRIVSNSVRAIRRLRSSTSASAARRSSRDKRPEPFPPPNWCPP